MKRRVLSALATAALVLGGCAAPPVAPRQGGWSGKLAYAMDAGSQQRAQAGTMLFEWEGGPEAGQLSLNSPLGTTLASARWDADGVWLDDGQHPRRYPNLEALGEALGAAIQGPALPLRPLMHWMRGIPAPEMPSTAWAEGFEQAGWRVQTTGVNRLVLSRPAQGGQGALRITLLWAENPG